MAARETLTAEQIVETATRLVERDGVESLTMRRLSEQLGVAVTSIYWHVGGRDALLDRLVERLLGEMAKLPAEGDSPVDRISSLARSQRRALIERQHLMAIAHERNRTPELFLPIQQRLAAELAELGLTGAAAALLLRVVEVHVISAALMKFSAIRGSRRSDEDPVPRTDDWPDRALAEALREPTDYDAVFEYGLNAILEPLRHRRDE